MSKLQATSFRASNQENKAIGSKFSLVFSNYWQLTGNDIDKNVSKGIT